MGENIIYTILETLFHMHLEANERIMDLQATLSHYEWKQSFGVSLHTCRFTPFTSRTDVLILNVAYCACLETTETLHDCSGRQVAGVIP